MNTILKNIFLITAFSAAMASIVNASTADVVKTYPAQVHALAVTSNDVFLTSAYTSQNSPYSADIRRTNKESVDISGDVIFRQEKDIPFSFDSLLHAEVAGAPYLYYVVNFPNNSGGGISYINRIPANGGPVVGITRPPYMGGKDLKTDGSFLYWADREAIRKIPMNGGTATILARVPNGSYAGQVALDSNYVYFNSGASGALLYRVPKAGGTATVQAIATSEITDLHVHQNGAQSTVYWGERSGAVRSYTIGANATVEYQSPFQPGRYRSVTSVAYDGLRVLWIDCAALNISHPEFFYCDVKAHRLGVTLALSDAGGFDSESFDSPPGYIVAEDPAQLFWSAGDSVQKYIYPALTASISPSRIHKTITRPGATGISATVNALASGGEVGSYQYSWSIDNGAFRITPNQQSASIYATMPDGEYREGTLTVTVTDGLGETVTKDAPVLFENPLDPGGQPQ